MLNNYLPIIVKACNHSNTAKLLYYSNTVYLKRDIIVKATTSISQIKCIYPNKLKNHTTSTIYIYSGCPKKCIHVISADKSIVFSLQIKPIGIDDASQTKL